MDIGGDKIIAAASLFPVSQKESNNRSLGLRHRAAVGLSEETDAILVVVSEATGHIAICVGGRLERNLTIERLKFRLEELLNISSGKKE